MSVLPVENVRTTWHRTPRRQRQVFQRRSQQQPGQALSLVRFVSRFACLNDQQSVSERCGYTVHLSLHCTELVRTRVSVWHPQHSAIVECKLHCVVCIEALRYLRLRTTASIGLQENLETSCQHPYAICIRCRRCHDSRTRRWRSSRCCRCCRDRRGEQCCFKRRWRSQCSGRSGAGKLDAWSSS